MATNEQVDTDIAVKSERLSSQALPTQTLVSQQAPAQVTRTVIEQVITTSGVSSLAGTTNQISVSSGTGDVVVSLPATITVTTSYQVGGTQVLSARKTGWTAWTGTATKTSKATYSGTASVGYVQAELQAVMDKLKEVTEAYKALLDDAISHGFVGT